VYGVGFFEICGLRFINFQKSKIILKMQVSEVERARKLLVEGELVAIPTETVYGLAGNALKPDVVARIFQVKNRPTFDPLIIHTHRIEEFDKYIRDMPPQAELLARNFMPGSLTLLLPKRAIIPDLVTAGLDTVAIRVPKHPITLDLLRSLDFPLAAPSANPFGYISPTTADHVRQQLGDKIPYILDGGACEVGIESTIIGFLDELPTIYRLGGVSVEAIEDLIGKVNIRSHSSSNPLSPGMLASHYAPRKPLYLVDFDKFDVSNQDYLSERIGILRFRESLQGIPIQNQVILSESGDFAVASQKLFAGMRYLDTLNIDVIYAELVPELDLGRAINDRLRRASVH
jgi:L-threonylcarbamoyladenylate synthase